MRPKSCRLDNVRHERTTNRKIMRMPLFHFPHKFFCSFLDLILVPYKGKVPLEKNDNNKYNHRGMKMEFEIIGSTMQSLKLNLERGESIYSEAGSLLSMSPEIELETNFTGGLGGVLKRVVTGNTAVLNHFKATRGNGHVSFSTRMPGHIIPLELDQYPSVHVQRHSFLCAEESVALDIVGNLGMTGFFGGNGLIYNKLHGSGLGFISVDGEVNEYSLSPGETILVHPGHLAAFDSNVRFELQRLKGFKNMFLGGDGIFLVKLTGSGKIWLHTLSLHGLADALIPYMPSK